jgi:L-ribulokinase
VYANVLGKPVLVPESTPTSIGSGIFAQLAAGIFGTVEEAQKKMCPGYRVYTPEREAVKTYEQLYQLYRDVYFAFGDESVPPVKLAGVLERLRHVAAKVRQSAGA